MVDDLAPARPFWGMELLTDGKSIISYYERTPSLFILLYFLYALYFMTLILL